MRFAVTIKTENEKHSLSNGREIEEAEAFIKRHAVPEAALKWVRP